MESYKILIVVAISTCAYMRDDRVGILVSWLLFNSGIVLFPYLYIRKVFFLLLPPFSIDEALHLTLPHFISTLKIVTFNPRVKIRTRKGYHRVNKYKKKDITMSHKLAIQ